MKVVNRKARYEYELLERFEAGIVLTGAEVKSVKKGQVKLDDAFVRIDDNLEAWLINSHVHPYQFSDNKDYNPTKSRKLLLHKKQIISLLKQKESKKLNIIPYSCYTNKGIIKLQLALARPKKKYQKKEVIKRRDLDREMERDLKNL